MNKNTAAHDTLFRNRSCSAALIGMFLLASSAGSVVVPAAAPDPVAQLNAEVAKTEVVTRLVRGDVSVIEGADGNIGVLAGADAKFLVDAGSDLLHRCECSGFLQRLIVALPRRQKRAWVSISVANSEQLPLLVRYRK